MHAATPEGKGVRPRDVSSRSPSPEKPSFQPAGHNERLHQAGAGFPWEVVIVCVLLVGLGAGVLFYTGPPLYYWQQSWHAPRLVGGSALAGHTGADSPAQSTPSVELPVHFLDASRQPNASDEVHSPPNASSQQQASLFRRSAEQQAVTQDAKGAAGNEFPAGGSPPQSPSAPPGPAQADNGTRSYPPGVTEEVLQAAARRLEELTSRPLNLSRPDQPWNRQPANYSLHAIDKHKRHNPSYRAVSDLGDEVFVKFPCFPGAEADFNGRGTCKNGMPAGTEDIPRRHQAAIQAVTDFCGLSVIKSRSWTAPVHAVTPEGIEVNGQLGFFAEWLEGTYAEKMTIHAKTAWMSRIPVEWMWLAALHDFILCESDRHQGNIVVLEDGSFRLIDNDHELNNRGIVGHQLLVQKDISCMPNCIWFPQTLESWRVWKYRQPTTKLDIRCWTGPLMDIPLPSKTRKCLEHFAASPPDALQAEFDLVRPEIAVSLRSRAKDLLEVGFWPALMRTLQQHEHTFWWNPKRPAWSDPMLLHNRFSYWRPLQEDNCTLGPVDLAVRAQMEAQAQRQLSTDQPNVH